jgi:hypothetical protein
MRRLVTIPGYALACLLALALAPLWVPAAAVVDQLRRSDGAALRSGVFSTVYLVCELTGLLICAALWLARPFASWDSVRWTALHYRLQDAWGSALLGAALRLFDLRVEIEGDARLGEGPYLLLLRHASAAHRPDRVAARALAGDRRLGRDAVRALSR